MTATEGPQMSYPVRILFVVWGAALTVTVAGCGGDPPPPPPPPASDDPGLHERDTSAVIEHPVEGTPGRSIIMTRTRADGWRKVEVVTGGNRVTFHDDPSLIMLDARGKAVGDRTAVCGLASADPIGGAPVGILCGVIDGATLGPIYRQFSDQHTWLTDICPGQDRVTLLYQVASSLFPAEGAPACQAVEWSAATGWAAAPTPSPACSCASRNDQPCTNVCYLGTGVMRDGECDVAGLTPACDDGDPDTDDFCTGLADQLCTTRPAIPSMP